MNFKTIWVGILGLFGMGPLAVTPTYRYSPKKKITQADLDRIEKARQKQARKQAKRLPPEMG